MVTWGKTLKSLVLFHSLLLSAYSFDDVAKLESIDEIRKFYGITREYDQLPGLERVTLAEIDQGYKGLEDLENQNYVPHSLIETQPEWKDFVADKELFTNAHGTDMLKIIYGMFNFFKGGPRFLLLNGVGSTAFGNAMTFIKANSEQKNIKLIGYSGSLPCCSNLDGTGPVADDIRDSIKPDQIFLTSVGDYGRKAYNGPVDVDANGYVIFRNGKAKIRIQSHLDQVPTTITLQYTGTNSKISVGSDKNLNIYLQKPDGTPLAQGTRKQVIAFSREPDPAAPGKTRRTDGNETLLLREEIKVLLNKTKIDPDDSRKNEYYTLYVTRESGQFKPEDRLQIIVKSTLFEQENPPPGVPAEPVFIAEGDGTTGEEMNTPADMEEVIAVGDEHDWSSYGPTYDGRWKPDVVMERSKVNFADGRVYAGTSHARAILTGIVTYLKLAEPRLIAKDLRKFVETKYFPPSANTKFPRTMLPSAITKESPTVSVREIEKRSSGMRLIVKRLRECLNGAPIAAWKSQDGHYILGVGESAGELHRKKSPKRLIPYFDKVKAEDFDRYVTYVYAYDATTEDQRRDDPSKKYLGLHYVVRDRKATEEEDKKRPWQKIGGTPEDYVEIRRIPLMRDGLNGVIRDGGWIHNVWHTPTIEELHKVVEKRLFG